MENSAERDDVGEISKRSESLGLHGVCEDKSGDSIRRARSGSAKSSVSGRNHSTKEKSGGPGQSSGRSRRSTRSRRGSFPNDFQPIIRRRRQDPSISGSFTDGPSSGTRKPQNPNGSSSNVPCIPHGIHDVSNALENGSALPLEKINKSNLRNYSNAQDSSALCDGINIPRRPRCVPRRRNSPVCIKEGHDLPTSIGKSSSDAHSHTLSSDLNTLPQPAQVVVGKRKRRHDEFKENGPSEWGSVQHCKQENGISVKHCKRENGSSVQVVQKRAQRNNRKRQIIATEKRRHLVNESLKFEDSDKFSENCHEDDEESLEQNAARMLSSRFDPRCTGHSGDKLRFSSKSSSESLSYPPLNQAGFNGLQSATSRDSAGRVLRPRKQNERGYVKKRRHFYEVCSRGVDPYWVLQRRIRVFWPLDQSWYFGLVKDYNPITKLHHVKYDDRDEEWTNLQNERFKLLLLPGEFSHKFDSEKLELKAKQGDGDGIASPMDDNCMGSLLESEPIISWLARSAHRVKKSSIKILKDKRASQVKNNLYPSLLKSKEPSLLECEERIVSCPSSMNSRKPSACVMPERSTDEEDTELTLMKTKNHCGDRKFSFVYFRRRFHKIAGRVVNQPEESTSWSFSQSAKLAAYVADGFGVHEESSVTFTALKQREGTLKFLLPLHWVSSLACLFENSWLYEILSLHHHGKLTLVWPVVCMEIVFLDNNLGLRFFSFKGYLQHAVAVLCLFIRVFHQPNRSNSFSKSQLPFTSIGLRLSCVEDKVRELFFYVYNFLGLANSQWLYLGRKLRHLGVTMKELPLSECTYANMWNLLCSGEQRHFTPDCRGPVTLENLQKMSWKNFLNYIDPRISADSHMSLPYFKSNEQNKSCPFPLSLGTVPAFLLFLHFKLLVEKNVPSISSKVPNTMPLLDCHPENYGKYTGECPFPVEDPDHFSEPNLEKSGSTLNQAVVGSRCLSSPRSKLEADALSISNDGDCMTSCDTSLSNEFNLNGKSAFHRERGENGCDETDSQFRKHPSSKSWPDVGNPSSPLLEDISSTEESEGGCGSFFNTVKVKSKTRPLEDDVSDRGLQTAGKSTPYLTWNTSGSTIQSPNPTAPRTIWHHNRQNPVSPSLHHHSKLLPEDWDGFVSGCKKPRTQVSYISPFGGYDIGVKSRSHYRRGQPYKRLKTDNAKKALIGYKSINNGLDSLTCTANVLVTAGDKGWRELSAQIMLESDDQKEWQIVVKVSGDAKYSYKAQQFLQPGTTNRFTHAMMWKGGKDWTLEFTDRSQWSLFKELYEECYNRSIRAASVKNIPIPGVRLIEDCDDSAIEVPFVLSSSQYFRQKGTDVDMALDPSRVLYDMDSEDEEWISKLRNSTDDCRRMFQGISEEMFEKAMDMFEKVAFAQHCDEFTDAEIDSFMAEVGPTELMKTIHEHWHWKRQKKGMPLIRQFQPALWERYQEQLKEWELTVSKMHNSNGCHEKALFLEKPPLFAFCLRPRGLEVPNKGSKQRSHKKFPVNGHHSSFARENHSQGKKLSGYLLGKERAFVSIPSFELSDGNHGTTWLQSPTGFAPRDPASGLATFVKGSSDRNYRVRIDRNNSKRMGMPVFPRDQPKMSSAYAQRTKENGNHRLNTGFPERFTTKQYKSDGFHRHQSDMDEFMLRDASSAAQHASNMAKLKREKAQWLMHKADLAIHKAVAALLIADAIKASEEDTTGGG